MPLSTAVGSLQLPVPPPLMGHRLGLCAFPYPSVNILVESRDARAGGKDQRNSLLKVAVGPNYLHEFYMSLKGDGESLGRGIAEGCLKQTSPLLK